MRLQTTMRDSLGLHALGFLGANLVLAPVFVAAGLLRPWVELGPVGAVLCAGAGAVLLGLAATRLGRRG